MYSHPCTRNPHLARLVTRGWPTAPAAPITRAICAGLCSMFGLGRREGKVQDRTKAFCAGFSKGVWLCVWLCVWVCGCVGVWVCVGGGCRRSAGCGMQTIHKHTHSHTHCHAHARMQPRTHARTRTHTHTHLALQVEELVKVLLHLAIRLRHARGAGRSETGNK